MYLHEQVLTSMDVNVSVPVCVCVSHWTWPETVSQRRCQLMADCREQLTEGERSFCLPQQPDLFFRMTDWGKSLLMLRRKGTTGHSHSGCVSTGKTARRAGTQQFGSINFWQCILVHSGANLPLFLFVGGAITHLLWVFLLVLVPHVDGTSLKIFPLIHTHL